MCIVCASMHTQTHAFAHVHTHTYAQMFEQTCINMAISIETTCQTILFGMHEMGYY